VWDVLRNEVAGWAMRPLDSIGVGNVRFVLFFPLLSSHFVPSLLTNAPVYCYTALCEPGLHILYPHRRHPRRRSPPSTPTRGVLRLPLLLLLQFHRFLLFALS
jgi:hypothetical protein